jgi:hypothetical protein
MSTKDGEAVMQTDTMALGDPPAWKCRMMSVSVTIPTIVSSDAEALLAITTTPASTRRLRIFAARSTIRVWGDTTRALEGFRFFTRRVFMMPAEELSMRAARPARI